MSKERIAELKAAHPELWNAKRAAGLSEETIAIVIQSQLDHDAANPPHLARIRETKLSIEMASAAIHSAKLRLEQAQASRAETLAIYPDVELPTLPSFSSDPAEFDELRCSLVSRETEVINLGAEIAMKNERIAQLEAERDEATISAPSEPAAKPKAKK